MHDGTIVALATPRGASAVAVVRISGDLCVSLFGILSKKSDFFPKTFYRASYVSIDGKVIDDVLAVFFANPNSYTGEDAIEVYCHGNMLIVEKILEDLCLRGCRLAEPGEFTKRAFLNRKLDLCQAEAVADVIHGTNACAVSIAQKQLSGSLSEKINHLSVGLVNLLASIEKEIDFSDDDATDDIFFQSVSSKIEKFSDELDTLICSNKYRSAVDRGIITTILGPPNAGKSSLFNFLLGKDRAIVSSIPGTTRDLVSEEITVGDTILKLWDTAGFCDHCACEIEKIGMDKAAVMAKNAGLFLIVADVNAKKSPELPQEIVDLLNNKNSLLVLNKIDLPRVFDWNCFLPTIDRIEISLKNSKNVKFLRDKIKAIISRGDFLPDSMDIVVNSRHMDILRRANESLLSAMLALTQSQAIEIAAANIRRALEILGEIVGAHSTERVLDVVFSNFCIGK
ncbi:MAG: tRNA uridine-5-carboxymethylaminomethyl(34) synthesis GTPase MnmE [Puniceicoccales bacterium]|jgi:tRNA modification GTPase|nr:tRNA uridine-5-carboxymethylaminomethyl(34) synthesis GTPase MnmE [Puniceicoccales bacterium]